MASSSSSPSSPQSANHSGGEEDGGAVVEHGSVAELLEQLGLVEMDPESVFDFTEVPGMLLACGEHEIQQHDPATGGDPGFGAVANKKSFWVKVASADALSNSVASAPPQFRTDLANGHPLYVYMMPTTPLQDAQRISNMPRERDHEMSIHICNQADLQKKLLAFNKANEILDEINSTRDVMGLHMAGLREVTQQRLQYAQELNIRYQQAKAAYETAKKAEAEGMAEAQGRVKAEHMKVLAASGRLLIAREAHLAMVEVTTRMSDLEESLSTQADKLEQTMRRLTFVGCADV